MQKLRRHPSQLTLKCMSPEAQEPSGCAELGWAKDASGSGRAALEEASFSEDR